MSAERDVVAGTDPSQRPSPWHPRRWPFWVLAGFGLAFLLAFALGFGAGLARPHHAPQPR